MVRVQRRACAFESFQLPAFDVDLDEIGRGQGIGGDVVDRAS